MTVCVLTGCSSGLGSLVLSQLVQRLPRNSTIFAAFRTQTPPSLPLPLQDSARIVWLPLDLSSPSSVDRFVEKVKVEASSIDSVLLNAATWNTTFRTSGVQDGEGQGKWAEEFVVNHLSQLRLVKQLLPLLSSTSPPTSSSATSDPHSRIIFTSSTLQNSLSAELDTVEKVLEILKDPTDSFSTPKNRYASSKLLQSLAYYNLSQELAKEGSQVDIVGVSPGFVPTTGLSRDSPWWQRLWMKWVIYYFPFCSTEEQGARKILECFNDFLLENPFPSETLSKQLSSTSTPTSTSSSPPSPSVPSTTSSTPASTVDSTTRSRIVFHPASLSPLEKSKSIKTTPLYDEISRMVQGMKGSERGEGNEKWEEFVRRITKGSEVEG
ncbi:hypothetical protein JCM16303_006812 [Sporobolomyces ruberrimus]